MRKHLFVSIIILIVGVFGLTLIASRSTAAEASQQAVANQIIAREKASVEAWQRKDKAFWSDFLTDDATFFSSQSPYLDTEPKVNFLPKFEQYAEMFKLNDVQMYNPHVQVYGDTAILTYNNSISASMGGQPLNYTGKVTTVYVKQGNTWRVVHSHETMNPAAK
jgi:ketosteroid isomerase-like protein